jgi:hypothetical protein
MPCRRRSRYLASALAVSALVAAGCGGGDKASSDKSGASSSDPKAVLASIKAPAVNQGPQKLGLQLSITPKGKATSPQIEAFTSKPITVSLSGPIEDKKADLSYSLAAGPITLSGGLRLLDDKSWVQVGTTWYELPANTSGTSSSSSTAVDPQKVLDELGNPNQYLKEITGAGSEKIEGIDSDHIKGTLDIPAFLDAAVRAANTVQSSTPVPTDQLAQAKTALQKVITKSTADVWVGKDDKFIHKLSVGLTGALTDDIKKQTGLDGFDASLSVQSTPTTSVSVVAPAGARPSSELTQAFGGVLGGLAGGLGQTSP